MFSFIFLKSTLDTLALTLGEKMKGLGLITLSCNPNSNLDIKWSYDPRSY